MFEILKRCLRSKIQQGLPDLTNEWNTIDDFLKNYYFFDYKLFFSPKDYSEGRATGVWKGKKHTAGINVQRHCDNSGRQMREPRNQTTVSCGLDRESDERHPLFSYSNKNNKTTGTGFVVVSLSEVTVDSLINPVVRIIKMVMTKFWWLHVWGQVFTRLFTRIWKVGTLWPCPSSKDLANHREPINACAIGV